MDIYSIYRTYYVSIDFGIAFSNSEYQYLYHLKLLKEKENMQSVNKLEKIISKLPNQLSSILNPICDDSTSICVYY